MDPTPASIGTTTTLDDIKQFKSAGKDYSTAGMQNNATNTTSINTTSNSSDDRDTLDNDATPNGDMPLTNIINNNNYNNSNSLDSNCYRQEILDDNDSQSESTSSRRDITSIKNNDNDSPSHAHSPLQSPLGHLPNSHNDNNSPNSNDELVSPKKPKKGVCQKTSGELEEGELQEDEEEASEGECHDDDDDELNRHHFLPQNVGPHHNRIHAPHLPHLPHQPRQPVPRQHQSSMPHHLQMHHQPYPHHIVRHHDHQLLSRDYRILDHPSHTQSPRDYHHRGVVGGPELHQLAHVAQHPHPMSASYDRRDSHYRDHQHHVPYRNDATPMGPTIGHQMSMPPNPHHTMPGSLSVGSSATAAPKNVPCRFFNKGLCTWGDQCRFLHVPSMSHQHPQLHAHSPTSHSTSSSHVSSGREPSNRDVERSRIDQGNGNGQTRDSGSSYSAQSVTQQAPVPGSPSSSASSVDYERRRRLAYESAPWNETTSTNQSRPRVPTGSAPSAPGPGSGVPGSGPQASGSYRDHREQTYRDYREARDHHHHHTRDHHTSYAQAPYPATINRDGSNRYPTSSSRDYMHQRAGPGGEQLPYAYRANDPSSGGPNSYAYRDHRRESPSHAADPYLNRSSSQHVHSSPPHGNYRGSSYQRSAIDSNVPVRYQQPGSAPYQQHRSQHDQSGAHVNSRGAPSPLSHAHHGTSDAAGQGSRTPSHRSSYTFSRSPSLENHRPLPKEATRRSMKRRRYDTADSDESSWSKESTPSEELLARATALAHAASGHGPGANHDSERNLAGGVRENSRSLSRTPSPSPLSMNRNTSHLSAIPPAAPARPHSVSRSRSRSSRPPLHSTRSRSRSLSHSLSRSLSRSRSRSPSLMHPSPHHPANHHRVANDVDRSPDQHHRTLDQRILDQRIFTHQRSIEGDDAHDIDDDDPSIDHLLGSPVDGIQHSENDELGNRDGIGRRGARLTSNDRSVTPSMIGGDCESRTSSQQSPDDPERAQLLQQLAAVEARKSQPASTGSGHDFLISSVTLDSSDAADQSPDM